MTDFLRCFKFDANIVKELYYVISSESTVKNVPNIHVELFFTSCMSIQYSNMPIAVSASSSNVQLSTNLVNRANSSKSPIVEEEEEMEMRFEMWIICAGGSWEVGRVRCLEWSRVSRDCFYFFHVDLAFTDLHHSYFHNKIVGVQFRILMLI